MEESTKALFVIDASYILAALMPDEQDECAVKTLFQYQNDTIDLISTSLLPYEIANSMRNNILRKRIPLKIAMELLEEFIKLEIPFYPVCPMTSLHIAEKHNISCYDASYVTLAKERNAQLLTFDTRLKSL